MSARSSAALVAHRTRPSPRPQDVGIAEGKPFSVDYPQRFPDRVKEDVVFENLKSTRFENKVNDAKLKGA